MQNLPATRSSLVRAFESFTHAAGSLENSYGQLQAQVAHLRRELEETNVHLARSLEENERIRIYLRRILEGLPCGVLVFDSQNILRILNPEARTVLSLDPGFSPETPGDLPPMLAMMLESFPQQEVAAEREWTLEFPEGTRCLGVTRARLAERDALTGDSIFILRDITRLKHLEKAREDSRRMESLAEVATLLAHEIRNPLGSLELFAGLLADSTDQFPEIRQWVGHLQAGLRTVSATVNNVLQFHSQPLPQLISVNISRLLRETVEFLRPLAMQRGMRIHLEHSLGATILPADPHRLQQVFFNLSLNAFRAMSPGGVLQVAAALNRDNTSRAMQIEFADQGAGIAAEHLEKIFRAGFTTTPGSPGLGLAVCKTIVEQHGGTIAARSIPGEGAAFRITFPLSGEQA
ncbi:MAG: PAS sensor protein [Acidobacteria bacterium]|nr:PAS sensor protein [Acidobacteriota bacterium]